MSDYFTNLGRATAAALAKNPTTRERIRHYADSTLSRHLRGPMARDAAVVVDPDDDLDPRGSNDPSIAEIPTGTDCVRFVELCLAKLDGDEREAFLAGLAQILDQDQIDGVPNNNIEALDRSPRSGGRSARDNNNLNPTKKIQSRFSQDPSADIVALSKDKRRLAAQDQAIRSKNASSFEKRWGNLTSGVNTGGRY